MTTCLNVACDNRATTYVTGVNVSAVVCTHHAFQLQETHPDASSRTLQASR